MGRGNAAKRVFFIVERGISFVLCASLCAGLTKIVSSARWVAIWARHVVLFCIRFLLPILALPKT